MKKVTTIKGDIAREALGMTSMHEHLFANFEAFLELKEQLPPLPAERIEVKAENMYFLRTAGLLYQTDMYVFEDMDYHVREVNAFKNMGGQAILDAGTPGIRGHMENFRQLADITGMNIICTTGAYRASAIPRRILDMSDEELMNLFRKEIYEGIDGTDMKAGAVKCALGEMNEEGTFISDREWRLVKCAAAVAAETGRLLYVHSTANEIPEETVYKTACILLDEFGIKPEKLLMCHMSSYIYNGLTLEEYCKNSYACRDVRMELPIRLLDKGISIGLDNFGCAMSLYPYVSFDDQGTMRLLVQLLEKGYENQIVFGHDTLARVNSVADGAFGMARFAEYVLPILKDFGYKEDVIRKLVYDNPANLLEY